MFIRKKTALKLILVLALAGIASSLQAANAGTGADPEIRPVACRHER